MTFPSLVGVQYKTSDFPSIAVDLRLRYDEFSQCLY